VSRINHCCIIVVSNQNRTLTMTLNREKARIVKLETEVASLKKQLEEERKEATTRPQSGARSPSLSDSSKQQRAKYDKLMQKNAELQQQITNLKNDYTKIKAILQREIVGNETNTIQKQQEFDALLEKLMNGTSDSQMSWRGRAQQIVLLKSQLKDMKRKYEGMPIRCRARFSTPTINRSHFHEYFRFNPDIYPKSKSWRRCR